MRRANVFVYDECINQDISFPELPVFLSEHYGQCAEDLIVASLLFAWSGRGGIALPSLRYLEVGGNHPIATSATFLLNRKFAMRGVIVEANPALIDQLQKIRPNDLILHGAVQTEPVSTISFSVSNQNEVSSLDRSFVLAWHGGKVGERALIMVPALRINEILETHFSGGPPAYLSIDVEGVDLKILEDLDWVRFRPVIVQVEPSDQFIPENTQRIEEFMATQNYVLIARTEVNLIFIATECLDTIQKGASAIKGSSLKTVRGETLLGLAKSQLEKKRAEISNLRKQLTASAAEVQARESVLRQLHHSRSWRMTAPLRALARVSGLASKPWVHADTRTPSCVATAPQETTTVASHNVLSSTQSFDALATTVFDEAPNTAASVNKDSCGLDQSTAIREDVVSAYKALLGREPENHEAIEHHRSAETLEILLRKILNSEEFRVKERNHPFFHYNATFDVIEMIRRHAATNVTSHPSYLTNYLGVRVAPDVCPAMLQGRAGQIEPVPIPGNWHADMAEIAAVLRSVELAEETFTMAELGCGWGCWMNNAGTVAKRRGLKIYLTGVEGDKGHIALARESLGINGFSSQEIRIFWGIAAATEGLALFPRQVGAGGSYGLEPIFNADAKTRAKAAEAGSHDELPMIPLSKLIDEATPRLDLLHIDIQGGEAALIHKSLELINKYVRYLVIGTHSREIEGSLFTDLVASGWQLEIERPAILQLDRIPKVVIDGVQGWRNRALTGT